MGPFRGRGSASVGLGERKETCPRGDWVIPLDGKPNNTSDRTAASRPGRGEISGGTWNPATAISENNRRADVFSLGIEETGTVRQRSETMATGQRSGVIGHVRRGL